MSTTMASTCMECNGPLSLNSSMMGLTLCNGCVQGSLLLPRSPTNCNNNDCQDEHTVHVRFLF